MSQNKIFVNSQLSENSAESVAKHVENVALFVKRNIAVGF